VDLIIDRNGEVLEKNLTTYKSKISSGKNEKEVSRIGVALETKGEMKANAYFAFKAALSETGKISKLTLFAITDLFKQLIIKFQISDNVSGPIGIVVATSYFAHMGFVSLLQFTAILSLSLAVFNILPIPALDGGHLTFTLIEMITRRKFSLKAKNIIQATGFSVLILLMIAVTVKDFVNFDILGSIIGLVR
jgi:regulator of sigma E protease